jgi:hypothetical protein
MADFSAVFNSIPPVTRFLLLGTVVVTGLVHREDSVAEADHIRPCLLGLLSPYQVRESSR